MSRRGASSTSTTVSPFATVDRHRDDLLRQAAVVGRGDRALVRAQRPLVEVRAGHLELVADLGRLLEHLLAAERVAQAVLDHRVERLDVAHAEAEARAWAAGTAPATSTPCRRRPRPRGRRRGRPGRSCPAARTPDAQTLLIVSEVTSIGIPASICAWREGICPWPGLEHRAHHDVLRPARARRRRARAPRGWRRRRDRWRAAIERPPPSLPIGVRAVLRITVRGMRPSLLRCARHATCSRPLKRRRTREPTRSWSGSSRTRAIAHDVDGVLQALVDSGEAQPRPAQARRHPRRRAALRRSSGSASATTSTPSAPAWPPRPSSAGRRSSARRCCAGRCPHHVTDAPPARSSRARCWRPTRTARTRASDDDGPRLEALILSAHHDVSRRRRARRDRRRGGQRRPRPPERARQRR